MAFCLAPPCGGLLVSQVHWVIITMIISVNAVWLKSKVVLLQLMFLHSIERIFCVKINKLVTTVEFQCPGNSSYVKYSNCLILMTPRRHCSIMTYASPVTTAHRLLPSAMWSSDDNDWPVHSLMLSLHDLRSPAEWRIPSTVRYSMIFTSVSWLQTRPNHDSLQRLTVTVKAPDVWRVC